MPDEKDFDGNVISSEFTDFQHRGRRLARLMILCGLAFIVSGLALMGYQRLGWPRSDIFAAGSFIFTVLCFIAATLAVPGMPRFFKLVQDADTTKRPPSDDRSDLQQTPLKNADTTQASANHQKSQVKALRTKTIPSIAAKTSFTDPIQPVVQTSPAPSPVVLQNTQEMANNQRTPERLYKEIGDLHQRTENFSNDWFQAVDRIGQERAAPYKRGVPGPMPAQLATALAQRLSDNDQQISSLYGDLSIKFLKTRQEAAAYMRLTPNQLAEDEANFRNANSAAMRHVPLADLLSGTPDVNRFRPMATYLQQLQRRVGDLH